jgi:hypothetical protein
MDDAQAVEDTARRFLEAIAGGEDIAPYLAEDVAWIAADPTERIGTVEGDADVRRLEVVRLESGVATVAALANIRQLAEHPVHGAHEFERDFDGRIELERVEGDWRITDWVDHGRGLANSMVRPVGVVEHRRLVLEVPALSLAAQSTRITLAVDNRGPHLVVLSELYRGARALGLWHYIPVALTGAVQVPARTRVVTSAGWRERFPVRTRELRFVLRAGEADGPERFELAFSVRRVTEQRLLALDRAPLLFRLPRRVVRYVRLAPVGLFVALLLLHQVRAAGVAFALYGVVFSAALVVWASRGRPVRNLVFPALVTIGFGVWLAWSRGSLV